MNKSQSIEVNKDLFFCLVWKTHQNTFSVYLLFIAELEMQFYRDLKAVKHARKLVITCFSILQTSLWLQRLMIPQNRASVYYSDLTEFILTLDSCSFLIGLFRYTTCSYVYDNQFSWYKLCNWNVLFNT
jgi:hypothetical protein